MLSRTNKKELKNILKRRDMVLGYENSMTYIEEPDFRELLSNARTLSLDFLIYRSTALEYAQYAKKNRRFDGLDMADNLVSLTMETQDYPLQMEYIEYFATYSNFQNLKNLYTLKLKRIGITDLTLIQKLKSIRTLDLTSNEIIDITPLRYLTNLTTLVLNSNEIIDITPLQYLTNLTYLDLYGNNIVDITPLLNLRNLNMLDVRNNRIIDKTPFETMTVNTLKV
jgi:Leucine-rich repeat (LRR) protein